MSFDLSITLLSNLKTNLDSLEERIWSDDEHKDFELHVKDGVFFEEGFCKYSVVVFGSDDGK